MVSLLQEIMEGGKEETEGPSQAGDVLVTWLIPWQALRHVGCQGQEKQLGRSETCPFDTAGIEEHTGRT